MLILRETPIFISCRDCELAVPSVWMSLDTAKCISTTVKKVCLSACHIFSTYGQQSMENLADNGLGLFVCLCRFFVVFLVCRFCHMRSTVLITSLFCFGTVMADCWASLFSLE